MCVSIYREKTTGKCIIKTSILHFAAERGNSQLLVNMLCASPRELTKLTEICFFNILVGSGEGNARCLGGQLVKSELGCNSEARL